MKSVPFSFICFLSRNLTSAFLSLFCPLKPMCCRVLFVPAVTQPPRCGATKVKVTPSALCIPMREQPSFLVSHLFAFDSEGQNKSSGPDHNGADFHAFFFPFSPHLRQASRIQTTHKVTAFGVSAAGYGAFVQVCFTCLW